MSRNILETAMGAIVLVIAVIFLTFAYSSAKIRSVDGYEISAKFDHVDGIRAGGDVSVSGIKVGTILSEDLDPKTYQAIVKLSIGKDVQLPDDSQAIVASAGLLGDKMLSIVPGASDKMIAPGGVIKFTNSPPSLETLLGQVVFSLTQSKKDDSSSGSGNQAPAQSGAAPGASPNAPAAAH